MELNWAFAARSQCRTCHTPWRGEALGMTEPQLRGTLSPTGDVDADAWHGLLAAGWIRTDSAREPELHRDPQRLVDPHDVRQSVDLRARSYLHANCAHCHLEGGNASVAVDVTHTKSLADTGLVDVTPMRGDFRLDAARLISPGDPARSVLLYRTAKLGSGRMPPIGPHGVDRAGVALLARWIEGLPPGDQPSTSEAVSPPPDLSLPEELGKDAAEPAQRLAAIRELLATPSGALTLATALAADRLDPASLSLILDESTGADPVIAELFEPWLPESRRVARLGAGFDPAQVLAVDGDPDSGRQLFLAGRGQCSQCHAIHGQGLDVGPELSRVGGKYPVAGEMLRHLIDPSAEIAEAYRAITVLTDEGQAFTGRLVDRSAGSIRLRDGTGRLIEIETERVEAERASDRSLMPENLLDSLTVRQAADLLAYLLSLR